MLDCPMCEHKWHGLPCEKTLIEIKVNYTVTQICGCLTSFKDKYADVSE